MSATVIAWDWRELPTHADSTTTWVLAPRVTICGGSPFVVASADDGVYRNDANGRAWKCVAARLVVDEHEGCVGADCPGLRYPGQPELGHYPLGRYGWIADR